MNAMMCHAYDCNANACVTPGCYNLQGMRGKLTIPFYSRFYDREKYFDWEMAVEQEFNLHLVPKKHRVKYATKEFKDFAQFW
jgi:hypothetical protein